MTNPATPSNTEIQISDSDVLGLQEIAILLDVRGRTPHAWKYRGRLPAPDYSSINGLSAWKRSTVIRWAAETGRLPQELLGEVENLGIEVPERRGGRPAAAKAKAEAAA